MNIKISTSGLRLNTEQGFLMERLCNKLCDQVIGELFLWKGNTGGSELYSYSPNCNDKGTMGHDHRRFYKFDSKDEMIGFLKALSLLDQETLQTNFL